MTQRTQRKWANEHSLRRSNDYKLAGFKCDRWRKWREFLRRLGLVP